MTEIEVLKIINNLLSVTKDDEGYDEVWDNGYKLFKLIQTDELKLCKLNSNEIKIKFIEFINQQQDLDSEFVKIVNDNFWNLL